MGKAQPQRTCTRAHITTRRAQASSFPAEQAEEGRDTSWGRGQASAGLYHTCQAWAGQRGRAQLSLVPEQRAVPGPTGGCRLTGSLCCHPPTPTLILQVPDKSSCNLGLPWLPSHMLLPHRLQAHAEHVLVASYRSARGGWCQEPGQSPGAQRGILTLKGSDLHLLPSLSCSPNAALGDGDPGTQGRRLEAGLLLALGHSWPARPKGHSVPWGQEGFG